MSYFVTDNCIKCKHTDCVEVCPVDCFYEGENMLVINPLECIDCGVCEPECPVDAIVQDSILSNEEQAKWEFINQTYEDKWPNIVDKKEPLEDAEKWNGVENKYEQHFSEKPGQE